MNTKFITDLLDNAVIAAAEVGEWLLRRVPARDPQVRRAELSREALREVLVAAEEEQEVWPGRDPRPPGFYTRMTTEYASRHYAFPTPARDQQGHTASDGGEWVFNLHGTGEWDAVSYPPTGDPYQAVKAAERAAAPYCNGCGSTPASGATDTSPSAVRSSPPDPAEGRSTSDDPVEEFLAAEERRDQLAYDISTAAEEAAADRDVWALDPDDPLPWLDVADALRRDYHITRKAQ